MFVEEAKDGDHILLYIDPLGGSLFSGPMEDTVGLTTIAGWRVGKAILWKEGEPHLMAWRVDQSICPSYWAGYVYGRYASKGYPCHLISPLTTLSHECPCGIFRGDCEYHATS